MRIGIFSDTHANIEALEAVQRALNDRVCLGDTVGYGASPNECCAIIREQAAHTILGNHDAAVAGRMDYSYYYHAARHALDLHARLLTPDNMQWLKELPYEVREGDIHYCHGSPLNIEEFDYIFARDQAAQCLDIWDDLAPLTLIGHSHLCKSFALSPDGVHEVVSDRFELRPGWKYIVSVGSVGQPRDYDPRASYTLFDTDKKQFEFKRVASAEKIFSADLEPNFGHRLFIGV
jgi:diadenosine tetraphosphatase ApaH/serine/threonine PP2A family protein phosphatase